MSNMKDECKSDSRLFHPILANIPLPIRFVLSGVTGNVFFMAAYNMAFQRFQSVASASAIFAVVQFACIIVNHLLNVGIVFGWPDNYFASLMSNMPIGLTSLAMGSFGAGYLERINFDDQVLVFLSQEVNDETEAKGGFYSSLVVMGATGIFNYVALNIVNKAPSNENNVDKNKEL